MAQVGSRPAKITRNQTRHVDKTHITRSKKAAVQSDDQDVAMYIQRVLGARPHSTSPAHPSSHDASEVTQAYLPALTSSGDLDLQLYAFIAIIIDQFVQKWYSKITTDEGFVREIVQSIAHATRAIEQRLNEVDLETLLLDEIPSVLLDHLQVVDAAQTPWSGCQTQSSTVEHETRYHTLRPHVALEPPPVDSATSLLQQENESAWCVLLVNRLLPLLLPAQDLQNPCLHVLVSEMFSELIMRNGVFGKACEPWLWWDGITKVLYALRPPSPLLVQPPVGRLEQYGLTSDDTSPIASQNLHNTPGKWRQRYVSMSWLFWSVLQTISTVFLLLRALTLALFHATSLPKRPSRTILFKYDPSGQYGTSAVGGDDQETSHPDPGKSIFALSLWTCLCYVLSLPNRMPWLVGFLALIQHTALYGPGRVGAYDGRIDRLISSHIRAILYSSTWLPTILRTARHAVFPGNVLAPGRPAPPTPDEVAQIRRDCAAAIVEAVPPPLRSRFFAVAESDHAAMEDDVLHALNWMSSAYVNKHLLIAVIERFAVRLFPEIAAREDDL